MGHVALFAGTGALETEARVIAALCERDGASWLVAEDHGDDERVLVVLAKGSHERGYRTSLGGVEDRVSGAGWIVANAADPRVLVSTRALTREERDGLRACDDCASLIGEAAAHALLRGRTDALHVYERRATGQEGAAANVYAHGPTKPSRPLRSRSVAGHLAKLPLELASSKTIVVRDDFDASSDGAWTQTPYTFGVGELVGNAVRMFFTVGLIVGVAAYSFTSSALIAVASAAAGIALGTFAMGLGAKQTVIGTRARDPVRVGREVRVAKEEDDEDAAVAEEEERAAR